MRLKPNSITLSGSKLVGDQLRTSSEPASVMEFGFYPLDSNVTHDANPRLAVYVIYYTMFNVTFPGHGLIHVYVYAIDGTFCTRPI